MKTRTWAIILVIILLVGSAGWGWAIYQYNTCGKGPFVFNFSWTGPTVTEHSNKPGCVKRDITIIGRQRDRFIDLQASDGGCNTGYRTMELDIKTLFPKWTLKLGILGGAGYHPEFKKMDALVGAEVELFRHYRQYAVGGGVWYTQGVLTEFKAGGIKADFLFSWGRQ